MEENKQDPDPIATAATATATASTTGMLSSLSLSSSSDPPGVVQLVSPGDSDVSASTNMKVLTFCVPLCSSTSSDGTTSGIISKSGATIHEDMPSSYVQTSAVRCVVGTIIVMDQSSAIVWMGWGTPASVNDGRITSSANRSSEGLCPMGPSVIAMPRRKFGTNNGTLGDEPPCTQLVGGENEDDQMMGWQMACRLSQKLGWPIMVSCSLASTDTSSLLSDHLSGSISSNMTSEDGLIFGSSATTQSHRLAAALGEKEVLKILSDMKK